MLAATARSRRVDYSRSRSRAALAGDAKRQAGASSVCLVVGARWLQCEFRGVKTSNLLPNAAHVTGHALRKSTL